MPNDLMHWVNEPENVVWASGEKVIDGVLHYYILDRCAWIPAHFFVPHDEGPDENNFEDRNTDSALPDWYWPCMDDEPEEWAPRIRSDIPSLLSLFGDKQPEADEI